MRISESKAASPETNFSIFAGSRRGVAFTGFVYSALLVGLMKLW